MFKKKRKRGRDLIMHLTLSRKRKSRRGEKGKKRSGRCTCKEKSREGIAHISG